MSPFLRGFIRGGFQGVAGALLLVFAGLAGAQLITGGATGPAGGAVGGSCTTVDALLKRAADQTIGCSAVIDATGALSGITTLALSGPLTSTQATGTAPFVIASTTNVPNLNASSLGGATFAAPGPIGSGTASTGAFTTLKATGQIESTSTVDGIKSTAILVSSGGSIAPVANMLGLQITIGGVGIFSSYGSNATTVGTVQFSLLESDGGGQINPLVLNSDGSATFLNTVNATTLVGAVTGNASTASALSPGRTINGTAFDGSANITVTVPIATGVSGLGTGVATALAVNVGSVGAFVVNGGALGTPTSGVATNLTGTAAGLNIGGTAPAGTLTGTTLNATVVTSSLTSVGTLGALSVTGSANFLSSADGVKALSVRVSESGFITGGANILGSQITASGLGIWLVFGPDATTRGSMQFSILESDGGNQLNVFSAANTGVVTMPTALILSGLTTAAGTPNSICQNSATKEITVNAALTCTVSSLRFKDHLGYQGAAMPLVMALRPAVYTMKGEREELYGLYAEDVATVDPRLVSYDSQGRPHSVRYEHLTAVLVKALQETNARVEALEHR